MKIYVEAYRIGKKMVGIGDNKHIHFAIKVGSKNDFRIIGELHINHLDNGDEVFYIDFVSDKRIDLYPREGATK